MNDTMNFWYYFISRIFYHFIGFEDDLLIRTYHAIRVGIFNDNYLGENCDWNCWGFWSVSIIIKAKHQAITIKAYESFIQNYLKIEKRPEILKI